LEISFYSVTNCKLARTLNNDIIATTQPVQGVGPQLVKTSWTNCSRTWYQWRYTHMVGLAAGVARSLERQRHQ